MAAPKKPMDHLEAEAKRDPDAPIEVPLADQTVSVLPVMDWRTSGLRALKEQDVDLWAEKCLAPGSYAVWQKVDPTMRQVDAFFTRFNELTGVDLPES